MRLFLKLTLALSLMAIAGCGYHMGSIAHPQVKSIAIAPVINDTATFNAASDMRMALSETFMVDGSYTLTSLEKADAILKARVINVAYTEITEDSYDSDVIYRPTEWRVEVTVEFTVIIPGKREPLIPVRTVTGNTLFQAQADMETNRRQATLVACADAAKRVTVLATEAW